MKLIDALWTREDAEKALVEGFEIEIDPVENQLWFVPAKSGPAVGRFASGDAVDKHIESAAVAGGPHLMKAWWLTAPLRDNQQALDLMPTILHQEVPAPTVGIRLEGGVVQSVFSDAPADYFVIDYDTDGAADDELTPVPQDGGGETDALVSRGTADVMPEHVASLTAAFDAWDAAEPEAEGMRP